MPETNCTVKLNITSTENKVKEVKVNDKSIFYITCL